MQHSAEVIVSKMRSQGVVPLFTHDDPGETLEVVSIAYECGIKAFEFTNRRARSFEVFNHLIKNRNSFPEMSLGIGTIIEGKTAQKYIDAGADFIISPILNLEMGKVCRDNHILWIAGCATPTEIVTARDHGSQLIKIFPGSLLGPGFVKAMLQVVPDLKLMITGGVEGTTENLSAWFSAGATCVGMGSQLFPREMLQAKNWKKLEEMFRNTLSLVQSIKTV
jgi:2-dehydro-3-deoxyphosphogluconate aldolase / (4S)-4-hydroxy-2-oxoglutarate aldolase